MKKTVVKMIHKTILMLVFYGMVLTATAQTISVDAFTDCWVALIDEQAAKHGEYGWWSVWHIIKQEKRYKETPCKFENVAPGKYTLVIYNSEAVDYDPDSGTAIEKSDGVVMEEIIVTKHGQLEYDFDEDDFTEWNCLSCPWLYVFDGKKYVKTTEVLRDVVGKKNQQTTTTQIAPKNFQNGKLKIRIQEEKDEITHLHQVQLKVNGIVCPMKIQDVETAKKLTHITNFIELRKGDFTEIEFQLPEEITEIQTIQLETNGFYEPEPEFLKTVKAKYLRK